MSSEIPIIRIGATYSVAGALFNHCTDIHLT